MEQTVTSSTTKGVVIGLILVIFALITYFLDIQTAGYLQFISYIILIAGVIWSVIIYGKQIDYNSTFGNYFAHGFKVAALVTCIMIIYVIIFSLLFLGNGRYKDRDSDRRMFGQPYRISP